ncbi:MAG: TIGR00303 family protein [Candidatus Bathyarchaeia archaeon]
MRNKYDIMFALNEDACKNFIMNIEEKKPIFICVIGTTETAKIPGISAAGKNPEFTDYTPPADVELLLYGECKCISAVPVTPEGIPTPALITMSALKIGDIPTFIVSGGVKIKPYAPIIDLGGEPGKDLRSGKAVKNPEEIFKKAELIGKNFSKMADYIIIGESVPGGTTTALAVMLAAGINAEGKVSSSMINNPHNLKNLIVKEAFKKAGLNFGDLKNKPLEAVALFGDPVMPAFAGLVSGAAEKVKVLMAGGTQMGAILTILKIEKPEALNNIAIGTTRWIIEDKSSDIKGIMKQFGEIPVMAANLNFSKSSYQGLKAYEQGIVKEGVGAGGASIGSIVKSKGFINSETLLKEIEKNYERLIAGRL